MLPLKNITIDQALREAVEKFSLRPALVFADCAWNYAELDREIDHFARLFLGAGIRKGTHVGILCEAEPNNIFSMFALSRIGAVGVLLNTSLRRKELKELLDLTDVEVLLIGDGYKEIDYRDECEGFLAECESLRELLYLGLSGEPRGHRPLSELEATLASRDELERARSEVLPSDDAFILFTSGTTSRPKAVMTTQYSRVNSGLQQGRDQAMRTDDRVCVAMPVFHCFCLSVNVMASFFYGACLCLPTSRRTRPLLEFVQKERCTVLSSVPAMFHAMMVRDDFDDYDLSSVRCGFIGGSYCTPERFKEIEQRFGFTLLSSLGQTEATAGITTASLDDPLDVRAVSVGHFMDHVEGSVRGPFRQGELPTGQQGEICVRGYVVMKEYYKDPEATAKAIDREGWLHTGDKGYLTEEGNVVLTGRIKEFIIRGGENISPLEIESVLVDDPRIRECKAVGVPDEHYGEEIALCLVVEDGEEFPEEEVRTLYRQKLAHYKEPRYILYYRDLPKGTSGKIYSSYLQRIATRTLDLDKSSK